MRLLHVYIDGYRNLKNVTVDFDKDSLTSVVIGENGSGKSNLIEAIVEVFRAYDLGDHARIRFSYDLCYRLGSYDVRLTNREDAPKTLPGVFHPRTPVRATEEILLDPTKFIDSRISRIRPFHLPDLIFGYYSGSGRKLEKLFDAHQSRYYGVINKEDTEEAYEEARFARRLFYCRPIHGTLGLLAYLAKPGKETDAKALLTQKLGITGFHSALAHFKEPSWFNNSKWQKGRDPDREKAGRGRRTYDKLSEQALDIWGARGPAGACARSLRELAYYPVTLAGKIVDDYRHKPRTEAQLACFLRDKKALQKFADNYETDQDMFAALEAADISDLFRDMIVWVTRKGDDSGDISFSDLSDGERQLLMVLGLIRVSRGKQALFLLDEPDTHLNPAWQLTYLDLIREWTEVAADEGECQIVMTTHNPLTIAALTKKEVRVMQKGEDDQIVVSEPYADPRGLGFTSTLTEIFGLPTTLDPETQKQIDERNRLARIDERSEKQELMLIELNDKLDRLGFMHESRDPLYDDFLKAVHDVKYADRPPMTQEQIEKRRLAMQALIKSLLAEQGKAH
ncbi:AAA family ATPase [Erythrobacter oryzae]|uniref:AAA family ATPase n=1 Tax=Erythrobacter oryzae TaxID=3019556 RepID=UPI0025567531|nr:AAA family ATPase [Erythrobacter sp. COR-2]